MTTKKDKEFYLLPEDISIYVSGRVWHELYPKVNPSPFLYKLYEEIDLASYGKGLEKFYFTFIVTQPTNNLHQAGNYFSSKKRSMEVAVRLPYEDVYSASEAEVFRMLEAAFLEGIDQIGKVQLPESFDYISFKTDVARIFMDKDWYVGAVPVLPEGEDPAKYLEAAKAS
jgi:hypothetical protein